MVKRIKEIVGKADVSCWEHKSRQNATYKPSF